MSSFSRITAVLALLCLAFFLVKPLTVKSCFYQVFRCVSKIQIRWQTRGWDEIQGPHFIIRYRPEDRNIARLVLTVAEKSYQPVSRNFAYSPRGRILVVVYHTRDSFSRSFGWAADEGAMGVYWAGVIRILSPSLWITETDPAKMREVFATEGPMVHELTHLVVDYSTGGNYTRWFTEGIAQYTEVKLTGCPLELKQIRDPDEIYPLSRMDREFDTLADQTLAYAESFQALNYLVDKYGEASLGKILSNLSRGRTMEASFRAVLGISLARFEQDFRIWAAGSGRNN